jgi:hypothetical protein
MAIEAVAPVAILFRKLQQVVRKAATSSSQQQSSGSSTFLVTGSSTLVSNSSNLFNGNNLTSLYSAPAAAVLVQQLGSVCVAAAQIEKKITYAGQNST